MRSVHPRGTPQAASGGRSEACQGSIRRDASRNDPTESAGDRAGTAISGASARSLGRASPERFTQTARLQAAAPQALPSTSCERLLPIITASRRRRSTSAASARAKIARDPGLPTPSSLSDTTTVVEATRPAPTRRASRAAGRTRRLSRARVAWSAPRAPSSAATASSMTLVARAQLERESARRAPARALRGRRRPGAARAPRAHVYAAAYAGDHSRSQRDVVVVALEAAPQAPPRS